ncbi:MAG: site-specific integrase [Coprococcus sp.]
MVKKVKKYPHAFFERNTWNHRTKKLLPDYTIKYGKKGGFETAEEAEKAYQEHIKEFDRKMNMTFLEVDKEVTLKNFLLYWYVSIFSERVQSTTRYLVSYVLYGMLLPNIDEKIKLKFVSTDYLNELLDKVAKYCKSAGFKSRETLYIAMKDAQFLRLIDNNPVKATKTYPRPKRKITVLNKSQTRCFLTAAKERNWFLEIILGLYCGLRKGEILGLKFDDFDFEERTVTVQRQLVADIETKEGTYEIIKYQSILRDPKSESGKRRLKVPEIILVEVERRKDRIQLLKERMGEDFQDQNFISCQKNGNPRGLCSLNTEIRRLCERNGLPHITVHGLRHMYATILAERGVPLTKISALLVGIIPYIQHLNFTWK